jgi:hypothetical protein
MDCEKCPIKEECNDFREKTLKLAEELSQRSTIAEAKCPLVMLLYIHVLK